MTCGIWFLQIHRGVSFPLELCQSKFCLKEMAPRDTEVLRYCLLCLLAQEEFFLLENNMDNKCLPGKWIREMTSFKTRSFFLLASCLKKLKENLVFIQLFLKTLLLHKIWFILSVGCNRLLSHVEKASCQTRTWRSLRMNFYYTMTNLLKIF